MIMAAYSGDSNIAQSTSTVAAVSVAKVASTTTLGTTPNPSSSGQALTLTATIAGTAGAPSPTGSVTFLDGTTVLGTAALSSSGVATFTSSNLAVGSHTITASYGGDANYLASSSTAVTQQVNSSSVVDGPTVTNLQRFGFHAQPTILVLTFSAALDPSRAANTANYTVAGGSTQFTVTSAVYNPSNNTVTLRFSQLLNVHRRYHLTVNGTAPNGLSSATGILIDGANTGKPGSNYVKAFGIEILAGPASAAGATSVTKLGHHRVSAKAVDALLAAGNLKIHHHHGGH
jgi:hypothetical protein